MAKVANNYIDNKKLYEEMVIHIANYKLAKEAGEESPRINDYIGNCVYLIANNLSLNYNFIGYSYREEMIGDGIENCLRYLHNFNPEKTKNPFSYFTQIIWYAFLRRIDKEKKQSYIKYKSMENSIAMNSLIEMAPDDASYFQATVLTMDHEKLSVMAEKYETKQKEKKDAAKAKGVTKFITEGENTDEQV
jgi:hypothetical protein